MGGIIVGKNSWKTNQTKQVKQNTRKTSQTKQEEKMLQNLCKSSCKNRQKTSWIIYWENYLVILF